MEYYVMHAYIPIVDNKLDLASYLILMHTMRMCILWILSLMRDLSILKPEVPKHVFTQRISSVPGKYYMLSQIKLHKLFLLESVFWFPDFTTQWSVAIIGKILNLLVVVLNTYEVFPKNHNSPSLILSERTILLMHYIKKNSSAPTTEFHTQNYNCITNIDSVYC